MTVKVDGNEPNIFPTIDYLDGVMRDGTQK
jgi:hypothetical protein